MIDAGFDAWMGEVQARMEAVLARVMPAAITTLAAILEHFGRSHLTVARGGIREGVILTMAEEVRGGRDSTGGC